MTVDRKSLAISVDLRGRDDDRAIHVSNRAMRDLSAEAERDGLTVDWSTLRVEPGTPVETRNGYGEIRIEPTPHTYYVDAVRVWEADAS